MKLAVALAVAAVFVVGAPSALAAPFLVNSGADPGDGTCDATCTLRDAILAANAAGGPDTITFNIDAGEAANTIVLMSDLPAITGPVTVDGYTEPGASANTLVGTSTPVGSARNLGTNADLEIVVDGDGTSETLRLTGGGSTVKGLVIVNSAGHGIELATGGNNVIAGNFVGVGADGETPAGNADHGVFINETGGNTIGGSAPADRNVITANGGEAAVDAGDQVHVDAEFQTAGFARAEGEHTTLGTVDLQNTVQGNLIGTDKDGLEDPGDGSINPDTGQEHPGFLGRHGVYASGGAVLVGGAGQGQGNVISGNGAGNHGTGVHIEGGNGHVVAGNFIGTNAPGTAAVSNGFQGVHLRDGASDVTVGGTTQAAGNLISGNFYEGVAVGFNVGPGIDILRNYIGTDVTGTSSVANTGPHGGIDVLAPEPLSIGDGQGNGNLVSGNAGPGILLSGDSPGHTVQGNRVGTNAAGTAAVDNPGDFQQFAGIQVRNDGNVVGGSTAGERNLVSGNRRGVYIDEGDQNDIIGNYVGTNAAGDGAIPNQSAGVEIQGGPTDDDNFPSGQGNLLSGNLISGNGEPAGDEDDSGLGAGVLMSPAESSDAHRNLLVNNRIGTDAAGTGELGNVGPGVEIFNGFENVIGRPGEGNTIAFNGFAGVAVIGFPPISCEDLPKCFPGGLGVLGDGGGFADGNSIRGNSIFENDGLGINLFFDQVTPNDEDDEDEGPNGFQNFPVLTGAFPSASTTVGGTLNSKPDSTYAIDFYEAESCDPSGHGEGDTHLGSTSVTTNGNGDAAFVETVGQTVPTDRFLTATATDAEGATSEFSLCRQSGTGTLPEIEEPEPEPEPEPQPQSQSQTQPQEQPPATQTPSCNDTRPPITKLKRGGLTLRNGLLSLRGRSRDRKACPSGVDRVQVSLARVRGRTGVNCRFIRTPSRYQLTRPQNCRRPILFRATGTTRWNFRFTARLQPGLYRVQARGTDRATNKETPKKGRNIVFFAVR